MISKIKSERVKVLILDDSVIQRNRSKKVELLTKIYNHVSHRLQKGFTLLTLGWSDGYSFVPIDFNSYSNGYKCLGSWNSCRLCPYGHMVYNRADDSLFLEQGQYGKIEKIDEKKDA